MYLPELQNNFSGFKKNNLEPPYSLYHNTYNNKYTKNKDYTNSL